MNNSVISLGDLLEKNKNFIIPCYQRGYIWGKSRDGEKNSVDYILDSIQKSFNSRSELFLQGITATENYESKNITLIDGQQRMTFFFLLLHYLGLNKKSIPLSIEYAIRKESQEFLENIQNKPASENIMELCAEDEKEHFQDIFYFKKTLRSIEDRKFDNKEKLLEFLLDNVKFLYVPIQEGSATKVFSMMNGNKAQMKDDELVKAEILRLISSEKNNESIVWEQNVLRARYAREWDRWLYWWNRDDVREFYHTKEIMGWLLAIYFKSKSKKTNYNFQNFHEDCIGDSAKKARDVFYELRILQKKFEDVFYSVADDKKLRNKIGAILYILPRKDMEQFIIDYFAKKEISDDEIEQYYKYVFLGLTHKKIKDCIKSQEEESKEMDELETKIDETIILLEEDNLYEADNDSKECAYRQLLRLNIGEDTRLGRTFDFSIWKERSFEHILVKSKAFSNEEKKVRHCIGNLVLLYKADNSSFGTKSFSEKKKMYFECASERTFPSRTLLHSMSVFAGDEWNVEEIINNKKKIIDEVKKYYGK